MCKVKWDIDTLRENVENNSNCTFIGCEKIVKNNKIRYNLKLKCSCGNYFEVELCSFNDKRRPKITCNECTNKKVSQNSSKWNDENLKTIVESNDNYKYLKFHKIKKENDFGYNTYIHIEDKYGYKYCILKSSFDLILCEEKNYIEPIGKGNPYSEYNAKIMIENNSDYKLLKIEFKKDRFCFHLQDNKGFKYYIQKSNFDTYLNDKNNNQPQMYYYSNMYNEYNAKLMVESMSDYKFIKLGYENDLYSFHIEDSNGFKYNILLGNFKKVINNKQNKSIVYSGGVYSVENIKNWLKLKNIPYKLLLDEYIGGQNLKFECDKCHIFKMTWDNFIHGQRCSVCNESNGEKTIRFILNDYNGFFSPQYTFDNCKNIKVLPFDFAIFSDKEKTKLEYLIEYQGLQHYEPVDFAGKGFKWAEEQFKLNITKDNIKYNYCNDNNIELIRIPYWEFDNIKKILEDVLTRSNLNSKLILQNNSCTIPIISL